MSSGNENTAMTIEIDGVTYVVSTHYSQGVETIVDKLTRLVRKDEQIVGKPMI